VSSKCRSAFRSWHFVGREGRCMPRGSTTVGIDNECQAVELIRESKTGARCVVGATLLMCDRWHV